MTESGDFDIMNNAKNCQEVMVMVYRGAYSGIRTNSAVYRGKNIFGGIQPIVDAFQLGHHTTGH